MRQNDTRTIEQAVRQAVAVLEATLNYRRDPDGDAYARMTEMALSVEYRTAGWRNDPEPALPDEYRIVLCTGGPHVQISGALDEVGYPVTWQLEMQDWGTPLQQMPGWSLAPELEGEQLPGELDKFLRQEDDSIDGEEESPLDGLMMDFVSALATTF